MHGYLNTHRGRDERLKAPANLTKPSRSWWRSVMADYALEPHHVRLLTLAAEAWARAAEAREQLAAMAPSTTTGSASPARTRQWASSGTPASRSPGLCASLTSTPSAPPRRAPRGGDRDAAT
jgi:hypothetical protein